MLKRKNGFMLIISSPSGCGKTTITRSLLNDKELNLYNSISATTRLPRVGEKNEVDYFFLTEDDFKKKINDGYFLEWAEVFGRYYGTPKYVVQERLQNGVDVVFDIDWQGANQLKAQSKIDTITIFILPPSIEELYNRLKNRNDMTSEDLQYRMNKAKNEIAQCFDYDYVVINDDLQKSIEMIKSIVKAEHIRGERQSNLREFVGDLLDESVIH